MNVIVLHNNNLPDFLLQRSKTSDIIIEPVSVELPPTDVPDFDTFISTILSNKNKVNSLCQYDVIVLPFNTTNNNLEYTGLRIAAHIRLTKEWNCMSTPILFLGLDTFQEINQFSELGCLLNSFNVFISSENKQEEIIDMLRKIKENTKAKDNIEESPEYKDFLKRMKSISAPANYATHHSLANEWAIMRWNDMFTNPIQIDDRDFTSMLYYKYLRVVHGNSQQMRKWKKNNPNAGKIEGIEPGKKLVLIDDEWKKGWSQLLKHISELSGFSFVCCPIEKEWDRETLIKEIYSFIDEDKNDADCYLLDLRLHDTDFDEMFLKQNKCRLSGFDVLDYIKQKNEANPVVVFSASNKLWNFKNAVWNYKDPQTQEHKEGAIDFVLKETPESALNASESYMMYCDFENAIKTSFKISVLKKVVDKQKIMSKKCPSINSLNEFVKLVLLDKGNNNNSMLKACLMKLWTFLEDYMDSVYCIIPTPTGGARQLCSKKNNNSIGVVSNRVFVQKQKIKNTIYSKIVDTDYITSSSVSIPHGYEEVDNSKFGLTLCSLYLKYRIDKDIINNIVVPLDGIRNEMSHKPDRVNLKIEQLYDFYFKIIVPVIEHDHK